jgi:nucleotide-binding universal stress UspA family protein
MKTLLIPIDFTETSRNAANYAADYCKQFGYQRIVLLKSFYDTIFDEVVISAGYGVVGMDYRLNEHKEAEEQLQEIGADLSLKNKEVEVDAIISELPLVRAVSQAIKDENPQAILLGSDTNAYDNDSYVGKHVIAIAKFSTVNVIIIPAGRTYHIIKEIVVPVDTFSITSLTKVNDPNNIPFLQKMKLNILKIDTAPSSIHNKQLTESEKLHHLLNHIPHELFFSHERKTIDAIMNFVKDHSVQLIVALPGVYSFLYRLTHQLISEAICRNTEKPVLILKKFPEF